MAGLRRALSLSVLMVLILVVVGGKHPRSPVSSEDGSGKISANTNTNNANTARAQWCRFNNGTYLSLGQSFMQTNCTLCQCTQSRLIRCQAFQCMPTYCIDNTMPMRKPGQCCTQCGYERSTDTCVYSNISFPHGAIMKVIEDKMQCWCQLGNIECRNYMGSLFQGMDALSDGKVAYIIVIVLIVVIIFGLLLCCACTFAFYYYYKKNQYAIQQAYDQYVGSAGWEPMNEGEENVVDANAEEKRLEAEQYQYSNSTDDVVPPPYIGYNGPYVSEQEHKQMQ